MAAHMTQYELAQKLEVSPSAIGMYEQGRRMPDHRILQKLCELFHTSADWLLYGETRQNAEPEQPVPQDIEAYLLQVRDGLNRHKHRLIYHAADGRHRLLAPEEVDRLWQAMKVAAEVVLQTGV